MITDNQLSRRVVVGVGKTICCLSLWKLLLVLRCPKRNDEKFISIAFQSNENKKWKKIICHLLGDHQPTAIVVELESSILTLIKQTKLFFSSSHQNFFNLSKSLSIFNQLSKILPIARSHFFEELKSF